MVKGQIPRVMGDAVGELIESGKKQASQLSPKQILKTAAQQIKGQSSKLQSPDKKTVLSGGHLASGEAAMTATDQQKLAELKTSDTLKRKEGLRGTRKELARMIIARYKEMQDRELQAVREREVKEKGHRLEAYEAGKAGAAETIEEQQQQAAELRKKQAEGDKGVQMPASSSNMPGLDAMKKKQRKTEIKSKSG